LPNSGDALNLRSFAFGSNQQQPTTSFISNVVSITDLGWSSKEGESSWIAVAGSSGAVVIWSGESFLDSSSAATNSHAGQGYSTTPEAILQQHTRAVNRLAWHPTRPLLLSTSQDGTTILWETKTLTIQEQQNRSAATFSFFGRPEEVPKEYCWKRKTTFSTKGDSIRDIKWSPHYPDCTLFSVTALLHIFRLIFNWIDSICWSHIWGFSFGV